MATVPTQRKSCSIAVDWTGLDWTGLDWTGLDWTGLDWTGLDWRRASKSIVNNVWAFKGCMMIFDFTY